MLMIEFFNLIIIDCSYSTLHFHPSQPTEVPVCVHLVGPEAFVLFRGLILRILIGHSPTCRVLEFSIGHSSLRQDPTSILPYFSGHFQLMLSSISWGGLYTGAPGCHRRCIPKLTSMLLLHSIHKLCLVQDHPY